MEGRLSPLNKYGAQKVRPQRSLSAVFILSPLNKYGRGRWREGWRVEGVMSKAVGGMVGEKGKHHPRIGESE